MNPKTCLIAGCLPLGIGGMLVMLMAAAFLGMGGGGEGESPGAYGGSNSAGGRWMVVKLPASWLDFYPTEKEQEDLRLALQKAVDDWQLPADEFLGILHRESSGNPKACGRTIKGKNYYAEGLAQLIPETAERLGVNENERCNPVKSVGAAGQLLDKGRTKANNDTPLPWGSLRGAYFTSYNPGAKGTEEYIWDGQNGKDGIKQYAQGFVKEGVVRFTPDSKGRYWQMLIDEALKLGGANSGAGTPVDEIDGVYSTDRGVSNQQATCAGSLSKMMVRVQKRHGGYSPDEYIVTRYRCIDLFKALVTDSRFKARVIAGGYSGNTPVGENFGELIKQNKVPRGALVFTIDGSPKRSGDGDHVFMFLGIDENDRVERAGGGGAVWVIDKKIPLSSYAKMPAIVIVPDTGIWAR